MEPIPDIFFSLAKEYIYRVCQGIAKFQAVSMVRHTRGHNCNIPTDVTYCTVWCTCAYCTVLSVLYCSFRILYCSIRTVLYFTVHTVYCAAVHTVLLCPYCSVQFRTVLYFTVRTELWCPNCTVPFILYCAVRSVCTVYTVHTALYPVRSVLYWPYCNLYCSVRNQLPSSKKYFLLIAGFGKTLTI